MKESEETTPRDKMRQEIMDMILEAAKKVLPEGSHAVVFSQESEEGEGKCQCPKCRAERGEQEKPDDCQCANCKRRRGEEEEDGKRYSKPTHEIIKTWMTYILFGPTAVLASQYGGSKKESEVLLESLKVRVQGVFKKVLGISTKEMFEAEDDTYSWDDLYRITTPILEEVVQISKELEEKRCN